MCMSQIHSLLRAPMEWENGLEALRPPSSATLASSQKEEEKTRRNTLSQPGVLGLWQQVHLAFINPTFLAWPHSGQGLRDCFSPAPFGPTETENLGTGQEPVTIRELSCDQEGAGAGCNSGKTLHPSPSPSHRHTLYPRNCCSLCSSVPGLLHLKQQLLWMGGTSVKALQHRHWGWLP